MIGKILGFALYVFCIYLAYTWGKEKDQLIPALVLTILLGPIGLLIYYFFMYKK